jgi:hypothetical protein
MSLNNVIPWWLYELEHCVSSCCKASLERQGIAIAPPPGVKGGWWCDECKMPCNAVEKGPRD